MKRRRLITLFTCVWLSFLGSNAWAGPELPLSLTVTFEPPVPAQGDRLSFRFDIQNLGEIGIGLLQLGVLIPQGTTFYAAQSDNENWVIERLTVENRELVRYTAPGLGGRSAVRLTLTVVVESGPSITLDTYTLTAEGLASPIVGEPITVPIATSLVVPVSTSTLPAAETPQPTPTKRPSPTPSPSPTVTVVLAELPPTPTPKLSNEQEQLGALTVSIFVLLTLIIALSAAVSVFRMSREARNK